MRKRIPFYKVIELLEEYKREHGNLLVTHRYSTRYGIKLGRIVSNIRAGSRKVTSDEKERLDKLGFVWKITEKNSFDKVIEMLKEYKREHGDLLVPKSYCTVDGINLGDIVQQIRKGKRKTTAEEKARLNEIGFLWKCPPKIPFDMVIKLLEEYKKEYRNLLIPQRYCTKDGVKLGAIVKNIRYGTRNVTVEEKAKLDELGFVWKVR